MTAKDGHPKALPQSTGAIQMNKIQVFEMHCSVGKSQWATDGHRWFSRDYFRSNRFGWKFNAWEPCDAPAIKIWVQLQEATGSAANVRLPK